MHLLGPVFTAQPATFQVIGYVGQADPVNVSHSAGSDRAWSKNPY